MKKALLASLFIAVAVAGLAQGAKTQYKLDENVPYYSDAAREANDYLKERCVLDIYYPTDIKNFPTVVWFHGGGLKHGAKHLPAQLKNQGICVVSVNYRLFPKGTTKNCLEDAAAAVAWTFKNIKRFGGDPSKIFISGHSAGGYLTSMVGLDTKLLKAHDIDANKIAGLIPLSGHTITHMTVREERGIPATQPIVDEFAPLYHVRKNAPPLLLITGDREMEMLGRYEENAYMMRMMKVAGHKDTRIFELDGYGHGMTAPAFPLLVKEIRRIVPENEKPAITIK